MINNSGFPSNSSNMLQQQQHLQFQNQQQNPMGNVQGKLLKKNLHFRKINI